MNIRYSRILVLAMACILGPFSILSSNAQKSQKLVDGLFYLKIKKRTFQNAYKIKSAAQLTSDVVEIAQSFGSAKLSPVLSNKLKRASQNRLQKVSKIGYNREDALEEMSRVYKLYIDSNQPPEAITAKLGSLPGIAYVEPAYVSELQTETNDPIDDSNLEYMNFLKAWEITTGSADVTIAIVDSGVDYDHEDLVHKSWVNQGEIPASMFSTLDTDGDDYVSSQELRDYAENNLGDYNNDQLVNIQDILYSPSPLADNNDNDDNGFVDDLLGWDFWDSGTTLNSIRTDNDPMGTGSDHGTHVAGISAAEANNVRGLVGTGYNVKYMSVKAGGIPDVPSTSFDESRSIGFGYDGILYAAINGADVINNSWGGGALSEFGREVVDFATAMGSVVIGASGNSNSDELIYPAGYRNVLSVGSIVHRTNDSDPQGTKSSFSNYGYDLDVLATGDFIESAVFNDDYGIKSGTSMASPAAAGLAALLASQYPDWGPERIRMQIRNSSTYVDDLNLNRLRNRLGHGLINAEKALSTPLPGIEITQSSFLNNSNGKLAPGETGKIVVSLRNHGETANNVTLSAEPLVSNLDILSSDIQLSQLATGDSTTIEIPIEISSSYRFDGAPPRVLLNITDGTAYQDKQFVVYENMFFSIMDQNRIAMSFGAAGTIGFREPFSGGQGIGFIPKIIVDGELRLAGNQLYEAGLIVEVDSTINSSIRGDIVGDRQTMDRDFSPEDVVRIITPGEIAPSEATMRFTTTKGGPLTITGTTYSFEADSLSKSLILRYDLLNTSNEPYTEVYLGVFNDWDVGNFAQNSTDYDSRDNILHIFDESGGDPFHVSVAHLGQPSSALAIDNQYQGSENDVDFNINDGGDEPGFSENEKSHSLRARFRKTSVSSTDISTVVASGPYSISAGERVTVGFVYAWGESYEELEHQIKAARALNLFPVDGAAPVSIDEPTHSHELPTITRLLPNYPNPFNPSTNLRFDLAQTGNVELSVYNILGQKVATLVDQRMTAGQHTITFDASRLGSGLYLGVLRTDQTTRTIKMNLIK